MEKGKTAPNKGVTATPKKEATANSQNNANKSITETDKASDSLENAKSDLQDDSSAMDKSNLITADAEGQDDEKSAKEESEELLPLDDHPYKDLHMSFEPTPEQLAPVKDIAASKPIQETPLVEITKTEQLEELIEELSKEKEIGVDLQWSDHGYQAVICLVMISTREKDYLIDAMGLKDDMTLLNDLFLDTKVVKIFHSTSNDLKVLQEDFDVFVVNLFDTQKAMRALGQTKTGLDVVLQEYKIEKDPTMSRTDFRKRPLPPKYKNFARSNSHFLIHLYEKLKNALIEANSLKKVLDQCSNDCRIVYSKVSDPTYAAVHGQLEQTHKRQMVALEKLNEWRHRIAEYVDINVDLVLSKDSMRGLAFRLTSDPDTILKICNYSEHVREHLQEIVGIMAEAKPYKGTRSPMKSPLLPKPAPSPSTKTSPATLLSKPPVKSLISPLLTKPANYGYQRKFNQTDFSGGSDYEESHKRPRTFYYEGTSRGRGRGRGEFYSGSTFHSPNLFGRSTWRSPNRSRGRGDRW